MALGRRSLGGVLAGRPDAVDKRSSNPITALPFLAAPFDVISRIFPGALDGLCRSERQILQTVETAPRHQERPSHARLRWRNGFSWAI